MLCSCERKKRHDTECNGIVVYNATFHSSKITVHFLCRQHTVITVCLSEIWILSVSIITEPGEELRVGRTGISDEGSADGCNAVKCQNKRKQKEERYTKAREEILHNTNDHEAKQLCIFLDNCYRRMCCFWGTFKYIFDLVSVLSSMIKLCFVLLFPAHNIKTVILILK